MHKKIKYKVNELVEEYNTKNVYDLCNYLNIKIFYHELGSNIKGFYQKEYDCSMIHLNNNLNEFEEIVVLAHEIGHSILHKETNICFLKNFTYCVTNKFENEANEFAAHLIISDKDLNTFSIGYDYVTIEQMSKHFKIPQELLMYKII